MKKITLWLFVFFTCWQISAQTGTVVVGVNDGTPNTSTGDPSPLQDYWKTQRTQYLYTASELAGAGLVAGNITEIGWVATALNASALQENYTISMKSTASTVLTTTFESGATIVYGPTDFTPSATGNVMFTLTTPFVWNGTSNIIVELCAGLASGTYTENVSCSNSTMSGNYTVYFRDDSSTAPCTQATGTITNQRPLLVATGNVASCLAPLNIVSANVTAFTANISWDAVTPTPGIGYEYVVSTSSVAPSGAGTTTTNIYASISSLLPQTTYYVFVRSNCAAGQFSGWNGPASFTTACAPITALPHFEPFNTFLPNQCWMNGVNGDLTAGPAAFTASGWGADGLANAGTTGAIRNNVYTTGANDWVISPQFTIPAIGYELKFVAAAVQYAGTVAPTTPWESDDSIEVLVSTTGTTNWTVLHTYNDTNQPGITSTPITLDLDAYASQTVRFAYRAVEGATDGGADIDFSIDNFEIRLTPSCVEPLGVVSASVTSTGAAISWDPTSPVPSSGYEYVVSTSNTLPTIAGTAVTTTYATLTGLTPATTYYVFVRANCGSSSFSPWTTSISFTTACASVTSFVQNFDAVTSPAFPVCWEKIGSAGSASINSSNASSAPNVLYMSSWSTTNMAVVKMQPVSNLGAGTHRLKLKIRGSWSPGGVMEFGYLTNPMDETTFVALTTMTAASLTYENITFAPPVGTYSDYPAFRHTGNPANSLLIDDVVWEAIPSCVEPTVLVYANIASSGADISWTAPATAPANGYEYVVSTSATLPTAAGTGVANTFVSVSGLTPSTTYYIFVRAICSTTDASPWVGPITFTTACVPLTTLPWTENFDALATGTNVFPSCWGYSNTASTWSISTDPVAYSGANSLRRTWSTDGWAFTPLTTLTAGTSYTFSYYVRTNDAVVGYDVTVGVGNGQDSAAMTTTLSTVVGYQGPTWTLVSLLFTPTVTGDYSFGVHVVAPVAPNGINFDNFELKLSPTTPPVCATNLVATPNTCGNFANNLTWDATPLAIGYYVTIGTTSGGTDIANAITVGTNAYSFSGSIGTTYFWKIVPYNGSGSATGCIEQSFTTAATGCYCASVPSSLDNSGITTALVGATSNPISVVTYTNLTATPVIVEPGATTNVQLTFSTGYTYDINIWIDFNNDFDFNDAGELVKTGIACTSVQPNTVDASFTMPLTAPTGLHRMRIGTADDGQATPNACYGGTYGVTLDFTVDTTLGSNSFDTSNFVAYPNPVKDVLNLSYKTAISNVRVVNLLGQEVLNTKANTNDVQVDMSALTAGAYIVNITVEDTVHTIKVIKE